MVRFNLLIPLALSTSTQIEIALKKIISYQEAQMKGADDFAQYVERGCKSIGDYKSIRSQNSLQIVSDLM